MCGITAYYHKTGDWKVAKDRCVSLLEQNKTRGTDSFGVLVSLPGKKSFLRLRTTEIGKVKEWKEWDKVVPGSFVLVHNRAATSTLIHWTMAHPFINEDKTVGMVHNGMIHSYMNEYERLHKQGHEFETYHEVCESMFVKATDKSYETPGKANINDSEVLLHEYEECDGDLKEVKDLFRLGSVAIGIIDLKKDVMIVGRDTNPLVTNEYGDGSVAWTSQHDGKNWYETNDEFVVTINREGTITIIDDGRKPHKFDYAKYGGSRVCDSRKTGRHNGYGGRYDDVYIHRDESVLTDSGLVITGTESPAELARMAREQIEYEQRMEQEGLSTNGGGGTGIEGSVLAPHTVDEQDYYEGSSNGKVSAREKTLRFLASLPPGVETANGTCGMCGTIGVVYDDPYGFGYPACMHCYAEMQYVTLDKTLPVSDEGEWECDEDSDFIPASKASGRAPAQKEIDEDGVQTESGLERAANKQPLSITQRDAHTIAHLDDMEGMSGVPLRGARDRDDDWKYDM